MSPSPLPILRNASAQSPAEIQENLRKVERRILWIWGNAAIIILSLTAAFVMLSVTFAGLTFAVRALIGLVVLFIAHMVYQHAHLRKIQRALAEHQIQGEVFRRMAMFDQLTGLYNRRFAEQRLEAEIARSERRGLSLIVVLVDLNDFKQINDQYGHAAGDQVLKEFAERLNQSTRGSDLAVRWGGDEFLLVLLDCELEQLSGILMRLDGLRVNVGGKELLVSFSVGWKPFEAGNKLEDLLEEADRNLYANKALTKERRPQPIPV